MALSDRVFNNLLGTAGSNAGSFGAMGGTDIGQAGQYFRTLLGGDRAEQMGALMPQINLAGQARDATKRQVGLGGGGRTGGGTAIQQQSEDKANQDLMTLLGTQKGQAAGGLSQIAGTELQTMSDALKTGLQAAQADVAQRNAAKAAIISAALGGAGKIVGAGIGRGWFG